MEERIALVGIIVEDPDSVAQLNAILHEYSAHIIGRMGQPHQHRHAGPPQRHQRHERQAGDAPRRIHQDRLRQDGGKLTNERERDCLS